MRGSVLVVDDDPLFGTAVARILSAEHHVERLDSATDALRAVRAGARFDVILCDLMMPEMSGMELHAALDALDPIQARRIIFLTGGAFTSGARHFLERVSNVHVEKPLDVVRLRGLVAERVRQTSSSAASPSASSPSASSPSSSST